MPEEILASLRHQSSDGSGQEKWKEDSETGGKPDTVFACFEVADAPRNGKGRSNRDEEAFSEIPAVRNRFASKA